MGSSWVLFRLQQGSARRMVCLACMPLVLVSMMAAALPCF
jgi:hypothetical protein